MKRHVLLLLFFLATGLCSRLHAQRDVVIKIIDSISGDPLPGVVVLTDSTFAVWGTDINGRAVARNVPDGEAFFAFRYTGYMPKGVYVNVPMTDSVLIVLLAPYEFDEVIITSTRTNSRIDDLPVKVEVLGQEDMDEESTLVPGGIGSILGDLSVITIQKTNPVNGNDGVRMQGLDVQYTQLLRDGLPLYDGFSGSFGVLAIPPLDLKQVEIIKGASSTLYGGGAISGLINFISRTPTDSPSAVVVLNRTSIAETNLNAFVSKRDKRIGATLFTGANLKQAKDINGDGFAEVPEQSNFILHPRVFLYPSKKITGDIGLSLNSDSRMAGDVQAIWHGRDSIHPYLASETVLRTTLDGHFGYRFNEQHSLSVKSTASWFDRSLAYSGNEFSAKQGSTYSEINYLFSTKHHDWVAGSNFTLDQFNRTNSQHVLFGDYDYSTLGFFTQEDWRMTRWLSLEAGIRADHHSRYGWMVLPAAGIFLKPTEDLAIRLHYGTGYKIPGLFTLAQPDEYFRLRSVSDDVVPELSNGYNMDVNYSFTLFNVLSVQLNQAVYYTTIAHPTQLWLDTTGMLSVHNSTDEVSSIGTDTYIRMQLEIFELYVGYNHTVAKFTNAGTDYHLPFNPTDKIALTFAVDAEKWRGGVEGACNANQYIYNNVRVPDYWFFAAMVERRFPFGSVVLNCENLGDFRQSKSEPLVTGSVQQPVFAPLWGPVEGRVINLSVKISL